MSTKKIISHTGIYTLSTIIRNLTGLIMLPIYTRHLNPSDYAVIELLSMAIDFVGLIIANRVGEAVFRFYLLEKDPDQKRSIISTSLLMAVGINTIGFAILFIFSGLISKVVFGNAQYAGMLALFAVTLVTEALIRIPLNYIRALERPLTFFFVNLAKLIAQVILNIYFVVIKGWGVEGVIYSALISSGCLAIGLSIFTFLHTRISFDIQKAKMLFLFGLPISLGGIASFFLTFGDRFFLTHYQNLETVGLYTLAYKFAFIYSSLCLAPFNQMWDVQKYKVLEEGSPQKTYRLVFNFLNLFLITVAFCISLYIPDLLKIMSDKAFWPAASIVPLLLLAYQFYGWSSFVNFGLLYAKETKFLAYADWLSAAVICALYFALIPSFGAYGAALATLVAYVFRSQFIYYFAKRRFDLGVEFITSIKLMGLAILFWIPSTALNGLPLLLSIASKTIVLLLYLFSIYYLPIFSQQEKALAINALTPIFRKFSIKK